MLSPAEIAAEMEHSLDFLATDGQQVPKRQRSMRAVFDYTWAALADRERAIFRTLAVFHGGFAREAVQQVSGASLRELLGLVKPLFAASHPYRPLRGSRAGVAVRGRKARSSVGRRRGGS